MELRHRQEPKELSTMARTRAIATAILLAALAVTGCAARQSDQPSSQPSGQVAAATPQAMTPEGSTPKQTGGPAGRPAVLADGRHPVRLAAIDPRTGTITFDLVQWYFGEDAAREAAKDHQESPPPNDYYIRNVNPKLRTLPTAVDATITVNNLVNTQHPVPVTLAKLATLTRTRTSSPVFWITVRNDQVVRIGEQWMP
jgi:hypothetical protein